MGSLKAADPIMDDSFISDIVIGRFHESTREPTIGAPLESGLLVLLYRRGRGDAIVVLCH